MPVPIFILVLKQHQLKSLCRECRSRQRFRYSSPDVHSRETWKSKWLVVR